MIYRSVLTESNSTEANYSSIIRTVRNLSHKSCRLAQSKSMLEGRQLVIKKRTANHKLSKSTTFSREISNYNIVLVIDNNIIMNITICANCDSFLSQRRTNILLILSINTDLII